MDSAWRVCERSLRVRSTIPVAVEPLRLKDLQDRGIFCRAVDPAATTETGYTRFLVPALAGWRGWAIYCDCDFLWLEDVAALVALASPSYAVMCVKHEHVPTETVKMDGRLQDVYPRKNWSSLMLWNCAHPANRALTVERVNRVEKRWLNGFAWLDDAEVGGLPERWNWLEGWSLRPRDGLPAAVHFTRGGPWFAECQDVVFGDLWRAELAALREEDQ